MDSLEGQTSAASNPTLYAVHVKSHGTSWRVLVRAESELAARASVEARGHTVVSVGPGVRPESHGNRGIMVCPVCNYSLRGLAPGPTGYVQCPECGAVPAEAAESMLQTIKRTRSSEGLKFIGARGAILGIVVIVVFIVVSILLKR